MTFDLNNWTEIFEAIFKGVPREQDIEARVILETTESNLISNWSVYDGVALFPICQTYDITGTTYNDKSWIYIPCLILRLPVDTDSITKTD